MPDAAAARHVPAVSVVVHAQAGSDLSRPVHVLRQQSIDDWEAVLVGEPCTAETLRLIGRDPRFVFVDGHDQPAHRAISAGLDAARGVLVSVLDARDYLAPHALESLIHACARSGLAGAYAGYAFTGPLGVLPGDPLTGATHARERRTPPPEVAAFSDLSQCQLFPLHACVIRRDALGAERLLAPMELGGDHDLLLRLAGRGARWAFAGERLASVTMDYPRPPRTILAWLGARVRLLQAHLASAASDPLPPGRLNEVLEPFVQAHVLLRGFLQQVEQRAGGMAGAGGAPGAAGLASRVAFGNLFAQWWQRLRFLGRPPLHALAASGWSEHAGDDPVLTPQRLAERLLESCEADRPIVLLGLGRNARHVARALRRLDLPIVARDDGLDELPPWCRDDGLDGHVSLLGPGVPWDRDAQYLMTVSDDERFLARLPAGLRLERWSLMPAILRAELIQRERALMLRGEVDTSTALIPPATRGVFAREPRVGALA
ncbi:MAG: hypothetical protein AB7K52_03115 [Phycisphaerales bacterium]